MNLSLREKVIVVSGGAKGIGKGIVSRLALEEAYPFIIDKDEDACRQTLTEIAATGGFGQYVVADLTEPSECERAIRQVVQTFGRIDGLVNNAGTYDTVGLENGSYEGFMASLHKNLTHYFLLAHHSLPYLKETKGSIVNISSKVAETGQGGTSAYVAANGARNALTREWALELTKYNIRVNAVIVAECMTPMYDYLVQKTPSPTELLEEIQARIPLGNRLTTPEEIANTVVFLLSKRSSHTTGQLIHVDGGYVHLNRALVK